MEKIQIPEGVNQMGNIDMTKFSRVLSDGKINVYTVVRDENDNVVGTQQVLPEDELMMEILYLDTQIIVKKEALKTCRKGLVKKLKRELEYLKQLYEIFSNMQCYKSDFTIAEIEESYGSEEEYVINTLSNIRPYTMKKTD